MVQKVGIVGCGNISGIYLANAALFRDVEIVACADLDMRAAREKAAAHGIAAMEPAELLADPAIDIVLNLTVPAAHAAVGLAALEAGKHVYCEKPMATALRDAREMAALAQSRGLRIGVAPDTVLGAATQTARRLIAQGAIGAPVLAVAATLSHGMESWHPTPGFFFKPGGGPVLDMGPYYLAGLVHLLGPVRSVAAQGCIGNATRTVTAPGSPLLGQTIAVETPTSLSALLTFESGAQATFLASWDVWASTMPFIEIHGTDGSLGMPDPNWFGGPVRLARGGGDWTEIASDALTFGRRNVNSFSGPVADYRGLGLAEMANAIEQGRPHRASAELGLHVLAVMEAILDGAAGGGDVRLEALPRIPAPLPEDEARGLLAAAYQEA